MKIAINLDLAVEYAVTFGFPACLAVVYCTGRIDWIWRVLWAIGTAGALTFAATAVVIIVAVSSSIAFVAFARLMGAAEVPRAGPVGLIDVVRALPDAPDDNSEDYPPVPRQGRQRRARQRD